MNTYKRYRFLPDIISYAVWLYYRFNVSHRKIEDRYRQVNSFTLLDSAHEYLQALPIPA